MKYNDSSVYVKAIIGIGIEINRDLTTDRDGRLYTNENLKKKLIIRSFAEVLILYILRFAFTFR